MASPVIFAIFVLAMVSISLARTQGFVVIGSERPGPLMVASYDMSGKVMKSLMFPRELQSTTMCMIAAQLAAICTPPVNQTPPLLIDFASGRIAKLPRQMSPFNAAFDAKRAEVVVVGYNSLSSWTLSPPKLVKSIPFSLPSITNVGGLDSTSQTYWFVSSGDQPVLRYNYSSGNQLSAFIAQSVSTLSPISADQVVYVEGTDTSFIVKIGDAPTNGSITVNTIDKTEYDAPSMINMAALDLASRTHYLLLHSLSNNNLVVAATDLRAGTTKFIPLDGPLAEGYAFGTY